MGRGLYRDFRSSNKACICLCLFSSGSSKGMGTSSNGRKQCVSTWPLETGLLVYVDDIILGGNSSETCAEFKAYLNSCFKIKDLGNLKYFLGIEVAWSTIGLFLNQCKFALDILKETGLTGCKPVDTPIEQNHRLGYANGSFHSDPNQYRRLVGRLLYLTITRPDITYVVHVLSQFVQQPRVEHSNGLVHVLRYLKGCPGQGILLNGENDMVLRGYYNADWASCLLTRKSVTGLYFQLGFSPILWRSKKQLTVSRSLAEAEYRDMAMATSEIVWLRRLLSELLTP
ncbi:PREDICTED: uncharacterized protein LOC109114197 [Nelumbo nucifera]|uniref:Uncharacterized protein LOC109114197 n=1 Tax=Nelumbo nucifera TaxID=4432 RepID=A0A1U8Q200_NELNU|nr:PREDICTED: uncharacterized protein LOC109114197 [Nelumbo nucifera]